MWVTRKSPRVWGLAPPVENTRVFTTFRRYVRKQYKISKRFQCSAIQLGAPTPMTIKSPMVIGPFPEKFGVETVKNWDYVQHNVNMLQDNIQSTQVFRSSNKHAPTYHFPRCNPSSANEMFDRQRRQQVVRIWH